MRQSQASFGALGAPTQYQGQIVGLEGSRLLLSLADQAGNQLNLRVNVTVSGSQVTGDLTSVSAAAQEGGFGDRN